MKKEKKNSEIKEFCMTDVDLLNLEKECAVHHTYVFKYTKMLEDVKQCIGEKKTELALCHAELEANIRAEPANFDQPEKPTVSSINSAIIRDRRHQVIQTEMDILSKRQGILNAAVSALNHKKSMIKAAVDLHGQNYFSTPHPNLVGEKLENFNKRKGEARDEAIKKRNKKKRKKRS